MENRNAERFRKLDRPPGSCGFSEVPAMTLEWINSKGEARELRPRLRPGRFLGFRRGYNLVVLVRKPNGELLRLYLDRSKK